MGGFIAQLAKSGVIITRIYETLWTQEIHMMKFSKYVATTFAMGILVAALSGCQKQEGPAEHAGKEIDNAVEKTGQQIEKAGDKIEDAAKDAKK
jgi:hypothetical protein